MDDLQGQFSKMLEAADQARKDKSNEGLERIIRAWPYLEKETQEALYNKMRFILAMKEAHKGPKMLRAWRWLLAWLYQIPAILRR